MGLAMALVVLGSGMGLAMALVVLGSGVGLGQGLALGMCFGLG